GPARWVWWRNGWNGNAWTAGRSAASGKRSGRRAWGYVSRSWRWRNGWPGRGGALPRFWSRGRRSANAGGRGGPRGRGWAGGGAGGVAVDTGGEETGGLGVAPRPPLLLPRQPYPVRPSNRHLPQNLVNADEVVDRMYQPSGANGLKPFNATCRMKCKRLN